MSSIEDNHVTDLLPAFVLDALTGDELHQVESHLAQCSTCQVELDHLRQIANDLPLALSQAEPPPELKRKLMQSVHSHKSPRLTGGQRISTFQSVTRFFLSYWPMLGLALIVILALGNFVLWRQLNLTLQQTSTPLRVVTLTHTQYSSQAVGTLVMSPDSNYCTLVVANLDALQPDKQYQVWLIKGTQPTSAGVFSVDQSGYASIDIWAPQSLKGYDAIGISIEPVGGSYIPTGSSVLNANLFR
jgi:anti-sigma-K factor RskA